MNFSKALESLKSGNKIQRDGWNGKGMYLTLIQGYPVNGHLNQQIGGIDDYDRKTPDGDPNIMKHQPGQMLSHVVMKTAGDSNYWGVGYSDYVPWLASQTDILAEDWSIVG